MKTILLGVLLICFVNLFSQNRGNLYNSTLTELSNTIGSFYTGMKSINDTKYNSNYYNTDDGGNAVYFYKSIEFQQNGVADNFTILIYPNPSFGIINITSNDDTAPICLEIYSSLGQKVYANNFKNCAMAKNINLNLADGVYYCRFRKETGAVLNQKLVIQNE